MGHCSAEAKLLKHLQRQKVLEVSVGPHSCIGQDTLPEAQKGTVHMLTCCLLLAAGSAPPVGAGGRRRMADGGI